MAMVTIIDNVRPPAPATKIVTNALDNLDRVKTLFGDKSRTVKGSKV